MQEFAYAITPVDGKTWGQLTQAAGLFNQPVTAVMENNHPGTLPHSFTGLRCDQENVVITAFKRSEDGKGTVVRAYETEGRQTTATLSGGAMPAPLTQVWKPWSIQTYYLPDGEKQWQEVLMTEFDM